MEYDFQLYNSPREKPKTSKFVGVSAMIHVGVFILASFLPAVDFFKDRMPLSSAAIIEFTPGEPPKGVQTEIPTLSKKDISTTKPVAVAKQESSDDKDDTPVIQTEKLPTKLPSKEIAVAKTLPPKVVTEQPKEEPVALPEPVVAAQNEVPSSDDADTTNNEPAPATSIADDDSESEVVKPDPATELKAAIEEERQKEFEQATNERLKRQQQALIAQRVTEQQRNQFTQQAKANWQEAQRHGSPATQLPPKIVQGQSQGASGQEAGAFGTPNGVRRLQDLKQIPGNPRPVYSTEDRRAGKQGRISLLAYVTKDGQLMNFKLRQSTGHRSLDEKTLTAVKKWHFYPGQEGWVEIPFNWSLKGEKEQLPGGLRRGYSFNN